MQKLYLIFGLSCEHVLQVSWMRFGLVAPWKVNKPRSEIKRRERGEEGPFFLVGYGYILVLPHNMLYREERRV